MKALVVGVLILILLATGIVFYYTNQAKTPSPITENNIQTDKVSIEDSKPIDSKLTIGTESAIENDKIHGFYDFYSQDGWGYSTADKRVLFFFASWCPTCKSAEEDFQKNIGKLPENVGVFKVHYNDPETIEEDKDLARKYGITYQHTFVQVDKDGNEITKWNGGGLDNLLSKIK